MMRPKVVLTEHIPLFLAGFMAIRNYPLWKRENQEEDPNLEVHHGFHTLP